MTGFIKRNGEIVPFLPNLDEYVKDDPDSTVETRFEVVCVDDDGKTIAVESFADKYPEASVIKWCILKHSAASAHVRKSYHLVW